MTVCGLLDFFLLADFLSIDLNGVDLIPSPSDFGVVVEERCVFVACL